MAKSMLQNENGHGQHPDQTAGQTGAHAGAESNGRRTRVGRIAIDVLSFAEAIDAIDRLIARKQGGTVFTPNVDHVVLADEDLGFREAYDAASLSLVDGKPVLWASRLLGTRLPEKISGSDLMMPLAIRAAERGWRVYLFGGETGVAESAKKILERDVPGINIVGTSSPRINLGEDVTAQAAVLDPIRAARPDIVFVALGAPKQEVWSHRVASTLKPAVFVGIGASLDFIAGTAKRAPAWVSDSGMEWLYRLAREPKRLWRRYLIRDPKFLLILLRQARKA
jgi:N-acetylglucosaminyldiphosphoundecaprenol N-acetyl-beta-D-mannosaminyltransferase